METITPYDAGCAVRFDVNSVPPLYRFLARLLITCYFSNKFVIKIELRIITASVLDSTRNVWFNRDSAFLLGQGSREERKITVSLLKTIET